MNIDLRAVRAMLLFCAAVLFVFGAGLNDKHSHKTVVVLSVGLALLALDRLLALLVSVRSGDPGEG
jgi:hypothetical protein